MIAAAEIAKGLQKARKAGDRRWTACCPAHDDRDPSLDIDDGLNGKPLVICRAGCAQESVIAALKDRGLWPNGAAGNGQDKPKRRIVATYDYHDHRGQLAYQVVRFDPKEFRQRRLARPDDPPGNARDGWCWSVIGVRQVPYRLPQIIEAMALNPDAVHRRGRKGRRSTVVARRAGDLQRHGGRQMAGGAQRPL